MTKIINIARPIALYLLVLVSGGYAGIHFASMMNPSIFGITNSSGDLMDSTQWAASWQITDGFMRVRMGVFGPMMQVVYLITLLLFIRRWSNIVFWLILISFGLFVADIVLTITQQIPINRYIESLDFRHLNSEQIKRVGEMHLKVIQNFKGRELFSIVSFLLIAFTPFFWAKSSRIENN